MNIENKKCEEASRGDMIHITDRIRLRSYSLPLDLRVVSRIVQSLREAVKSIDGRFLFRKLRSSNAMVWIQKFPTEENLFTEILK